MNKLQKTALSGFIGTSFMTASSELMSVLVGENFREPDHLETMIARLAPHRSKQTKKIAGWGAHYAMGFVFAAVYVELWETRKIKHSLKNGLILGVVSGVLGYLIWKGTFKAHPLPPWINYSHYYLQRIPAHIVFAVFATITYRFIKANETEEAAAASA
ncbi:hypothetical protein IDJ77_27370 [Mucilaginibacter sp. ZT4R22]|uniref:Membrane protein YagU involved in acid resistance n=1 Tax=Mucilaginibacter pankratovii TaxID=2772110 RepID=A0ABR7WZ51_9SPHI|nr:hypothetical protein [Mucilaginibacter pankratovii]MBD1367559.1 hypothetical protein [Mucilaginibacter pankratovii]